MTRDQMELYRTWVQQFGGGFVMIGGENSFGVGGYFRTPIEQMLPVRMDHDDRQETPSVALYIVLGPFRFHDRPGRAAAPARPRSASPTRAAVLAMNVLQSKDLFGLTAVDTQVNSVVPLGRLGNKAANEQKILAITAGGGGIYIYTGLADALKVMRDAPGQDQARHPVLRRRRRRGKELRRDARRRARRPGHFAGPRQLALLAEKVTTSVVGLGTEHDKDVTLPARAGRTRQRAVLPDQRRHHPAADFQH